MDDEYDDFEEWEADYWLVEKKEFDKLIKLREARAARLKEDIYAKIYLGEAYVWGKKYEKALAYLKEQHNKYPDIPDFSSLILDVLKALGLSEEEFEWKIKPKTTHLDEELFQQCISILKKKRKNRRTIIELYSDLIVANDHLIFSEEELENWLRQDERLEFMDDKTKIFPLISIIK